MVKIKYFINHYKNTLYLSLFSFVILSVLTTTLVLVRTNQDTRSRAASSPCTLSNPILIDTTEQEYMRILNEHRESLGKGPLRLSEKLSRAAQWQAEDMVENNYFSHNDSLGRNFQQRISDCGINSIASENIATSMSSARAAFDAWQASTQGHKANMENASWTQTGISRVVSGGRIRWSQTFSGGNDGTSPDLENPNEPNPTSTLSPTPTTGTGLCTGTGTNNISGVVYLDKNGNANFDQGIDGYIADRDIILRDSKGEFVQAVQSGQYGAYCFSNLNDETYVSVIQSKEGWTTVEPVSGSYNSLTITNGTGLTHVDFGLINSANPTVTVSPQPTISPSITPNLTPPVNPKVINFSFRIPGIGSNTALGENPNPPSRLRTYFQISDSVKILDFKYADASFDKSTSQFKGSVQFENNMLQPDNFIYVTLPYSKPHTIIVKSLPQEPMIIPTLLLRLGDYNYDESFDLNDYIDLTACLRGIRCSLKLEYYDINFDGAVDSVDLNILYRAIRDFNQ